MFKMTVDREKYFEKALSHYRSNKRCTSKKFILSAMIQNGIIMNAYYVAMYFEIKLDDAIAILTKLKNEKKIKPVFSSSDYGVEYYLRGDLWDFHDTFMQIIRKKYPKSTRMVVKKQVIDISDVICYYGISRSTMTHTILPKLRPKVIHTSNNRQNFYLLEDFIDLKEHPLFKKAVNDSRYNFSAYVLEKRAKDIKKENPKKYNVEYKETEEIFRDTDCSRYDSCANFAVVYTDYMDCSLCYHYLQKKRIKPPEIFDPKTVFIRKNNSRITKMFEKIYSFPNSL